MQDMASICNTCKTTCVFKSRPKDDELFGASCDSCDKFLCKNCTGITTTEAHAVALSQRHILFYCTDCRHSLEDLPKLRKLYSHYEKAKSDLKLKDAKITKLQTALDAKTAELETRKNKLHDDNISKDNHITQIARFKDEVAELNTLLSELHKKNNELETYLTKIKSDLEHSEEERTWLSDVKINMLTTIETLNEEKRVFINDIEDLKRIIANFRNCKSPSKPLLENKSTQTKKSALPRIKVDIPNICKNVLVLTDGYGKYLYNSLKQYLGESVKLQLVSKPNASFRDITLSADCYIREFSSHDYVIVLLDPNNLPVSLHDITLLANKCFYTNLIFCTSPGCETSGSLEAGHCLNNKNLINYIDNLKTFSNNIGYIDLTKSFYYKHFIKRSLFLNKSGLNRLALLMRRALADFVGSSNACNLVQLTQNGNSNSSNLTKSSENKNKSTNYSRNDCFLVLSPIPKKSQ